MTHASNKMSTTENMAHMLIDFMDASGLPEQETGETVRIELSNHVQANPQSTPCLVDKILSMYAERIDKICSRHE